jgi:hypothetical protein
MSLIPQWLHWLASPPNFYRFADRAQPWLTAATVVLLGYGLVGGLALAPPDYQQGEGFRIIYVHVPAAWMSLFVYTLMAAAALVALVWRLKLAECVLTSCAPKRYAKVWTRMITRTPAGTNTPKARSPTSLKARWNQIRCAGPAQVIPPVQGRRSCAS